MGAANPGQQVHVTDAGSAIAESVNAIVLLLETYGAVGITLPLSSRQGLCIARKFDRGLFTRGACYPFLYAETLL